MGSGLCTPTDVYTSTAAIAVKLLLMIGWSDFMLYRCCGSGASCIVLIQLVWWNGMLTNISTAQDTCSSGDRWDAWIRWSLSLIPSVNLIS